MESPLTQAPRRLTTLVWWLRQMAKRRRRRRALSRRRRSLRWTTTEGLDRREQSQAEAEEEMGFERNLLVADEISEKE